MRDDLAKQLEEVADAAERHAEDEDHGPSYRRRHPPQDPAQVYSLRIPVDQIEELRQLAADKGVTPSALMRAWVLERIAAEKAGLPNPLSLMERLQEVVGGLEDAQRLLRRSALARRRLEVDAAYLLTQVSLDPQDEEHEEIRSLITDRVVERMETEIAEWRSERASHAQG